MSSEGDYVRSLPDVSTLVWVGYLGKLRRDSEHNTSYVRSFTTSRSGLQVVDGKCYAKHSAASARYLSSLSHTTRRFSAQPGTFSNQRRHP
jgi:hypothetical protein